MSHASHFALTYPEPDIALLTLDAPESSANVLSRHVMEQFEAHLDALDARDDLAGLIIRSGKPGMFIAGADVKEFAASIDSSPADVIAVSRGGHRLLGRLASAQYVSVAAIDGVCLGGGAELAIWCDRRILTRHKKTAIGFPEVKLGLFPGWGGTARTPRMIGLANAVEMATSGENVDAAAARLLNLAEQVLDPDPDGDRLLAAAIHMVREEQQTGAFRDDRVRWSQPIAISDTELGFLGATASALIQQQTKGHYPAPLACLEVMLGAASVDLETALEQEAEGFARLFGSPINRALLNVFFLHDRNKKDPGARPTIQPREIHTAAVVGAGIMGQGIAAANVKRGIPVALTDSRPDALARGVQAVLEEASYSKQLKGTDPQRAVELAPLVNGTTLEQEVAAADIIIEAIIEKSDAKRQLFASIEPQMTDTGLLCSNTSTIPITQLARDLAHPERFCGLHFFNPVRKMPLVEVIRGAQTSDETVATAVAYAKRLGKSPVVVGDGPGFLVNRLLLPYMNEAALLLSEGVPIRAVEKAAKAFGMPIGPLALYDVVGLDTCVHAGQVMLDAFPDRVVAAPIVEKLVAAGRLGQKNGRGFFDYDVDRRGRGTDSQATAELIASCTTAASQPTPAQLADRLFLPMVLEATRALEDGLVRDVRDVDLALIFGIGFPPFRGGLLFWADTLGTAAIVAKLADYQSLGKRFEPTPLLTKLANANQSFYDQGSCA